MWNNQGKRDTKTRGSMERNNTNKGIELILRKTENFCLDGFQVR